MLNVRENRSFSSDESTNPINYRPNWIQQIGTENDDRAYSIAQDNLGNLYLGGQTQGALGGTFQGEWDIWFAKYDPSSTPLWIQQLGSDQDDRAYSLTSDPLSNLYIAGTTSGTLGETHIGGYDALIAKYDSNGNPLWIKQFGSVATDDARTLATDSLGNLYLAGDTWGDLGGVNVGESDAWVGKYDSNGNPLWVQQLGSPSEDRTTRVDGDRDGNLYVTGYTFGSLGATNAGNADAWVAKYDPNGQQQWVRQFGTEGEDQSNGLALDSAGNIYLTGWTEGILGESRTGNWDAWFAKYDPTGNLVWIQQLGSASSDGALDIKIDSSDRIYLTGNSWGAIEGPNTGDSDIWVAQYNTNGDRLGGFQFGSSAADSPFGMTVNDAGRVYLGGWTLGDLGGSNAGSYDAWIAELLPNAAPIVETNTGLTLEQGARVAIAPTQLQVTDPDGDAIVYTVTALPDTGILFLNQTRLGVGNTFTQADIDTGELFYNHDNSQTTQDRFQFTATDGQGGAIAPTEFAITINPINEIPPFNREWIWQAGSFGREAFSIAGLDSVGNIYVTGSTSGDLGGTNAEAGDAVIAKYDSAGNQLWLKQFGTAAFDGLDNGTVDSAGNIYVTGSTWGDLGSTNAGNSDAFVAKYDSLGNQVWLKQFGTPSFDSSRGVVVDHTGNIYLSGYTAGDLAGSVGSQDAWVAKYDSEGNQLWVKQFGTTSIEDSFGIAIDSTGNLYLTGRTLGDLAAPNAGGYDAWIAKYDSQGNQLWVQQLGSAGMDIPSGVAVDSAGNLYVAGSTAGQDAWIAKYDSNGNQLWINQWGSPTLNSFSSIAIDSTDNIYLTGSTSLDAAGQNTGSSNVLVAQYDSNGNQLWIQRFGTSELDISSSVAVDSAGHLYLSGATFGNLAGTNVGVSDAWVGKFSLNSEFSTPTPSREIVGTEGDDTLFADVEDETIFGQAGNDILYGNLGDDTLFAEDGNDILYGDMGDDTLFEGGNDRLYGNAGDDILFGNAGNDTLYGGKGNDFLLGEEGDDVLSGDLGDDTLAGGNGRDIFVLQSNSGSDIILDFIDGEDVLELPANLSFTDLAIASNNGSTIIQLGDDTLATLSGVEPTVISQEDFISL